VGAQAVCLLARTVEAQAPQQALRHHLPATHSKGERGGPKRTQAVQGAHPAHQAPHPSSSSSNSRGGAEEGAKATSQCLLPHKNSSQSEYLHLPQPLRPTHAPNPRNSHHRSSSNPKAPAAHPQEQE